ncbi:hypothetical protein [Enterobacter hormaechei]|uniref:hypothetical protein n=1 Tax=Enterobacter hormaechei TaxID=158836 RepID=UPI000301126E|nr:hypothetical protein [Enterobacter hormaechei]
MYLIALSHRRALRYPACREALDMHVLAAECPPDTIVITFARAPAPARKLDACCRLQEVPDGDVVLTHFDTTPLYALLFWDIALHMAVGRCLYLQQSDCIVRLLERSWYRKAFRAEKRSPGGVIRFTKVASLPAEADRGLGEWSFCIPTGNGDPTALNLCVARILELALPVYEIILCGLPAAGFRYWSQVRIVGEDIAASPLHITRKKNLLARTARYPNLCILHDRVLLPRNFYTAVQRFGDDFPLTGFQSFWFAGTGQTLPLRYSDFGVATQLPAPEWPATRPSREEITCLADLPLYAQHPARSDFSRDYLTGSLYLCKRSVWAHIPQNEALFWQDYEDLEQAFSAAQAGIPSRINPYTLTQSLSYRSVMHYMGRLSGITRSGRPVSERPWGTFLLPRRPHLPVREAEGHHRLRQFAARYTTDALKDSIPPSLPGIQRYRLIIRLLWAARGNTDSLLNDWYQLILCESPVPDEAKMLEDTLNSAITPAEKKTTFLRHPTLIRQVFNNIFSSPFQPDAPRPTPRAARIAGSLLSAFWLRYGSRHTWLRLSVFALWRELASRPPRITVSVV